tara:strand:+ start:786 stop:1595 length:810 start_codon:yes stop_codon:yes gene_type:complete
MYKKNNTLLIYSIIYFAFLYIPVMLLPIFSFNDAIHMVFPLKGFTFKWYDQMIHSSRLHKALMNSVKVGLVASVCSTFIALLAAKAFTRYKVRLHQLSYGAILLPFVIPEIIIAVALIVLWTGMGLQLGLIPVTIAHILFCTPFCLLILISRMEGFDKHLEEAAMDLGENAWGTFWRVTFPLVLPAIIASLLLSFVISFDEFILAFFLSSSDQTLPMYMWGQMRFPKKLPHVLALGAVIIVVTSLIVIISYWLRNIGNPSSKKSNIGGI